MIGYYNYTVLLTYISLISAGSGIVVTLSGKGHPYFGMFFLLLCGLCDAFDGKVARTKENRSENEENYGIQIDSLSDLVAFGVLPACIGAALIRISPVMKHLTGVESPMLCRAFFTAVPYAVLILYILAAMIRLAYFNVQEESRKKSEGGVRKFYTGLPVTAASLIFPLVMLLQYIIPADITPVYYVTALLTGFAFLSKLHVKKPGTRGILIMICAGLAEFLLIIIACVLKIIKL